MFSHEQVLEIFNHRYSCKEFLSQEKISESDMEIILKAGQLSPSSMGLEPWKFLVVENEALIKELIPVTPGGAKQLATCSHLIIILSRQAKDIKHDSDYIDYLLREVKKLPEETVSGFKSAIASIAKNRFNHDDQAILNYSSSQAYLAIANMALAGSMLGIDSCMIGGFDAKAVTDILVKHHLLDPEHFSMTLMLPLGKRIGDITPKSRQPFNTVVEWVK